MNLLDMSSLKATRDISKKNMAFCSFKNRSMYFHVFPMHINAPPGRENSRGVLDPANLAGPQTNKTNRIFSVAEKSCKAQGRDDNL